MDRYEINLERKVERFPEGVEIETDDLGALTQMVDTLNPGAMKLSRLNLWQDSRKEIKEIGKSEAWDLDLNQNSAVVKLSEEQIDDLIAHAAKPPERVQWVGWIFGHFFTTLRTMKKRIEDGDFEDKDDDGVSGKDESPKSEAGE